VRTPAPLGNGASMTTCKDYSNFLERHIHALGGIRPRVGAAPRIHRGFIGNDYDEMEITALCNLIEVASGVRKAALLGRNFDHQGCDRAQTLWRGPVRRGVDNPHPQKGARVV